jgi:hypothetical protein
MHNAMGNSNELALLTDGDFDLLSKIDQGCIKRGLTGLKRLITSHAWVVMNRPTRL